jgi:hypothetical protein
MNASPSNSDAQSQLEAAVMARLGAANPAWRPALLPLPGGKPAPQPDAVWYDGERYILAECYLRLGKLKPSSVNKLVADASKLRYLRRLIGAPAARLLLAVPAELAAQFSANRWQAEDFRSDGVEFVPLTLLAEERAVLLAAAQRQGSVFLRGVAAAPFRLPRRSTNTFRW